MGAALPARLRVAPKAQPGLVDEGGGLEGMSRCLAGHFGGGNSAQLGIDELHQLSSSLRVASAGAFKD